MKLGVQLFGCSKDYNADPAGFLRQLKEHGYTVVEPCILFSDMPLPVWSVDTLDEHIARVRELGLEVDSFHSFAGEFWNMIDEHVDACRRGGFKRVVLGYRGAFEKTACDEFARHCVQLADGLAAHGIELWLHNSWQEIAGKVEGMSAYEYILRACGGKLGAQVDTGWVVCGGENLMDFLVRNEPYVRSIHHKDVASLLDENNKTDNLPLGAGIVDTRGAFEFGKARNLRQLVDQDFSLGILIDDLAQSARYINSL